MSQPERVLIVAQSPVLRVGIQWVMEGTGDYRVVGTAENGLEASVLAGAYRPTLAVIQDALTGVTGVVVARAIRDHAPHAGTIVLSEAVNEDRLVAAVMHGVDALLPAAVEARELLETARKLVVGRKPLNELVLQRPALAARIFDQVRSDAADGDGGDPRPHPLSGREIAILDGVVRGLTNRQIAAHLFVVEQTVKNHMTSLLRKLEASDRTEAVVSAVRTGMIDLGSQLPSTAGAVEAVPVPPPSDAAVYSSAA